MRCFLDKMLMYIEAFSLTFFFMYCLYKQQTNQLQIHLSNQPLNQSIDQSINQAIYLSITTLSFLSFRLVVRIMTTASFLHSRRHQSTSRLPTTSDTTTLPRFCSFKNRLKSTVTWPASVAGLQCLRLQLRHKPKLLSLQGMHLHLGK